MTQYTAFGTESAQENFDRQAEEFDNFANPVVEALSVNYPEMAQYMQPDVVFPYEIPAQAAAPASPGGYATPGDLSSFVQPTGRQVFDPQTGAYTYVDIPAQPARTVTVAPRPEPTAAPDMGVLSSRITPTAGLTGLDYQMANQQNNMIDRQLRAASNRDFYVQQGYTDWYPATASEQRLYGQVGPGGQINPLSGMINRPFVLKDVTGGGQVEGAAYAPGAPPLEARGGTWVDSETYMGPDGRLYTSSPALGIIGQQPPITWDRGGTISQIEDVAGGPAYGLGPRVPRQPVDPNTGRPVDGGAITPATDLGVLSRLPPDIAANLGRAVGRWIPKPTGEPGKTVLSVVPEGVQYWDGSKWQDSINNPALGTVFGNLPQGVYDWVDGAWKRRPDLQPIPLSPLPGPAGPDTSAIQPIPNAPLPGPNGPDRGAIVPIPNAPLPPGGVPPATGGEPEALQVDADGTVRYRDPSGNWYAYNPNYPDMGDAEAAQFAESAAALGPGVYNWTTLGDIGGEWTKVGDVAAPQAAAPETAAPPSNDPYGDRLWQKLAENGLDDLYTPMRNIMNLENAQNDPTVRNTSSIEDSVGLFQINMKGQLGVERAAALGAPDVATAIEWLKDPETNINFAVDHFIMPRYQQAQDRGLSGYDLYNYVFQPWSTKDEAIAMYYGGGGQGSYAASAPSSGLTAEEASYTTETTVPPQGSDAPAIYPAEGIITQRYGDSEAGVAGLGPKATNKGIDIAAPLGTPIRTTFSGEVVYADNAGTIYSGSPYAGWGNTVVVRDSDGNYHQYGHLSSIGVSVGDFVDQGAWVGNMGGVPNPSLGVWDPAGNSTGSHLSYDVYYIDANGNRRYFDPSGFLYGRSA